MTPARSPGLSLAALVTLGLLAAAHPAHAATNIVVNGSFESPVVLGVNAYPGGTNYAYNPKDANWTFDGDSGLVYPPSAFSNNAVAPSGYDGFQYAFLQTHGKDANQVFRGDGSIYQKLTLTAGTQYDYSFRAAGRPDYNGNATDTVSLAALSTGTATFDTGGAFRTFTTVTNQGFNPVAGSFTVDTTGNYNLTFNNITSIDPNTVLDETSFIDSVNVSAAPEPSQLAGLAFTGFGALGLILKTRKRKASEVTA